MMYKTQFNQKQALRFRHFSRKGYALFACLGRVVTIGVLSVATLRAAAVTATDTLSVAGQSAAPGATEDSITDKEATLDEVEITGSRAPLALGQAARMVTVLNREDIQAAPVQSINDLMKMAVGVDVRQRGPLGAQTDIGIRGSTCEQVAILLNGINIGDAQTGHNAFDLPCDVSDIVRIEVLEGPAARVYGTSSLAGAINIVTRESADGVSGTLLDARVEGGSFGYLSAAARLSLPSLVSSHLSASVTRSDGYSRSQAGSLNSDYSGGKAFAQSHWSSADKRLKIDWQAGLAVKGFGSNTFYSVRFDEQYERTLKMHTALQGELTAGGLHLKPAIYWQRGYDRFELERGSEEKVPYNYHRTDVAGILLNGWFDWTLGRTAVGAEFRNEDIASSTLGEPTHDSHYTYGLNRSNLSIHAEHNVLLKNFTLSAGVLVTRNTWNQRGFRVYPGIDASLRLGSQWKLYASYNTSLRQPSFTELYYSVGGHQADKYLKPEELRAVEGGVKLSMPWLTAQAAIFHHHSRNMIDWVMDTRETDAVWQSVNHTKVNTLGQEITLDIHHPTFNTQNIKTNILLSYCHLHQQKQDEDYLLSRYALEYLRHKVSARLMMTLGEHLEVTAGWRWQDRMGSYTTMDGKTVDYHPYSVIDARVAWKTENYSLYVNGNNLTSHRYVDYGNVPQPGCWVTAGVSIKIKN